MYEDIKYAVYNGSPMGVIPGLGNAGRYLYPGSAIRVTPGIRFRILAWLNGTDAERSYFTPIDQAYFESLPRCVARGCNVAFTTPESQRKHIAAHDYVAARSPELAELNQLRAEAQADREERAAMRERMLQRRERVQQLRPVIYGQGHQARIVQPGRS